MRRADLARLLSRALDEVDLASRVSDAVGPAAKAARIVAIGKAAPAMAAGAIARLGEAIDSCLVVAPDETDTDTLRRVASRARIDERLVVMRAAHPLPDARSVRAGAACLAAMTCTEPRQIVVLVSGGASSLVCAPSAGVTLRDKRDLTSALLRSGAPVQDLNVVRKHLSRIKGGGLARAAGTNAVLTLIASDVIGGSCEDVGSGPSIPDATTVSDARRVLRRWVPSSTVPLVRTFHPAPADAKRLRAKMVASPEALALSVAKLLRARGIAVRVLPPSQAGADELAAEYLAHAASRSGVVRVAEPSVTVPARGGRGGRSTHLATLVGRGLSPSLKAVFAAFATDGVDGTSTTGGAIVDERFVATVATRVSRHALERALRTFDTGPLHVAAGTALRMRPTGHNLGDVHVLLVE